MLSRFAQLFKRKEIPEKARIVYESSKNLDELVEGLDRLKTENELEFNRLKEEVLHLEEEEQTLILELQNGLTERRKKFTLQAIQRCRKQMENLERRMSIHDRNILLHLTLIGKILDLEAMEMKGVDEKTIEDLLIDFETKLENYLDTGIEGIHESTTSQHFLKEQERELSALEQEILGTPEKPNSTPASKPKKERQELLEE